VWKDQQLKDQQLKDQTTNAKRKRLFTAPEKDDFVDSIEGSTYVKQTQESDLLNIGRLQYFRYNLH